jgi:hypothetical protein
VIDCTMRLVFIGMTFFVAHSLGASTHQVFDSTREELQLRPTARVLWIHHQHKIFHYFGLSFVLRVLQR